LKGFGDGFGTHFGRAWSDVEAAGDTDTILYLTVDGEVTTSEVVPGTVALIEYTEIAGAATGNQIHRRRRRAFFFDEIDVQVPGSEDTIRYIGVSGKATGNAIVEGSKAQVQSEFVQGPVKGQKVSVVSGKAIGDAVVKGSISVISVSVVSGDRFDNDFLMTNAEPVVDPIVVDNDLMMAA
jgi:hypothetical protein